MTTDWVSVLTVRVPKAERTPEEEVERVRQRRSRGRPKATPGPWQQSESMPWEVVDANGVLVTSVQRCDCLAFARMHDEAAEENARLIAAAPEMLAALEALVGRVRQWPETFAVEVEQAEKAVRKARGGE